ncbi:serine protease [Taibaiella sp. KBW10]|uniref:trypsin-like peptidase domain-containing protein n=1 Tax=Taibaiella sp. KBW10 TaxID=2153357 RepID=UPI000F5B7216|nr:trypsin-like peptidase domain-containing protein [Taibaiella sp. KBW10]RQO31352.1 serine protease [Taibaiella sp. KBW10]
MKKLAIPVIAAAVFTSVATVWAYDKIQGQEQSNLSAQNKQSAAGSDLHYANNSGAIVGQPIDFTAAAENTVKSVVHIKTMKQGKTVMARDPFDFWGEGGLQQFKMPDAQGGGSGVIISTDGYILTNNHVVDGADEVQVTFNNRNTQTAKVVGKDPATDLAILKIEGQRFPALAFGNSDEVKLGQWVLAVGYPLNLDATVTAGIVSAKGRSIGINQRQSNRAIESFIQTDAAVNPGNSGGALVNTQGQLIGINSAIASPTGTYAGYSYAIPSNLARKIANDLIKFGSVQRGYIGVSLGDLSNMTEEQAKEMGISKRDFDNANGVYVGDVVEGSGAAQAGIKKGDFITAINGTEVNSSSVLTEQIARYNPGDKVQIDYLRNGKPLKTQIELKANKGMVAKSSVAGGVYNDLGAGFKALSKQEAQSMGVDGGILVESVGEGTLRNYTGIKKGFIITSVNGKPVSDLNAFQEALGAGDMIQLGGTYAGNRGSYFYSFNNIGKQQKSVD